MASRQRLGEHELGAQQADAVNLLGRNGFGRVRHRQIDVDPGSGDLDRRFGGFTSFGHRHCRGGDLHPASQHAPVRPVDGHRRAVMQIPGGGARADDARNAQLAGNDRGVTRHAAGVGDQRRGPADGGQPIRIGHLGDQDLALEQPVALIGGFQHAHLARRDSRRGRQSAGQHGVLFGRRCRVWRNVVMGLACTK